MKAVKEIQRTYWKRETVEYPSGEVKFESSTAGNYNIDLLAGEYEIICVGGGGGGASNANSGGYGAAGGGGSGGYSNETVTLTAGNYTAIVGAGGSRIKGNNSKKTNTAGNGGDSSFSTVIAYHGNGGTAYMVSSSLSPTNCQGNGGAGGSGSTQNGNSGAGTGTATKYNTTVSGGASVYGGYGAGGDGCATNPGGSLQNRTKAGDSGYVKVTCYSEEIITPGTVEDYDFYTDEYIYKVVQTTQSNTNCLTYIPQDIEFTLASNVLTLKAGSRVYTPNGFEQDGTTPRFDVTVLEEDAVLSNNWGTAEQMMVTLRTDGALTWRGLGRHSSGTTAPTATNAQIWYDTSTNLIKYYSNKADTGQRFSFPLAIVTKSSSSDDTKVASIDQIFNGFGYIGNNPFVLPGVKCLIPNGKNADGSYKVIERVNDKVYTYFIATSRNVTNNPLFLTPTEGVFQASSNGYFPNGLTSVTSNGTYTSYYDKNNNFMYFSGATANDYVIYQRAFCGYITYTNGVCSNLRVSDIQSETLPLYKGIMVRQSNSNCLTHVPQDIDLELSNGTYTLKAGSKVYVPNGFEQDGITPKFDEYVFENDYSSNYDAASAQRAWILDTENNTIFSSVVTSFYSGASAPSGSGRLLWYDTDSNKIKKSEDGGSTWSNDLFSFPIFLGSIENNKISSIDQVFNGFGYIGSTVFVLKGVKGLSPNGRNADGTYKANAWELDRCYVSTRNYNTSINQIVAYLPEISSRTMWFYNTYVESDSEPTTQTYCLWYNPVTNVSKYRAQTTDNWTTVTQANLLCWVGGDGTTKIASLYDIQPVQPEILYS